MISIIAPIYNTEKYIAECIESVLSQSFTDWELILVDDGSPDHSGLIADNYARKEPRIKVAHIENGGLSWARNHGLDLASGEYVTFLDSDDALLPDSLQVLHQTAVKYDADIVEGKTCRGSACRCKAQSNPKIMEFTPDQAMVEVLYQKKLDHSACGKLYRRELFQGIRFTEGILYEDLDFFYRFIAKCRKLVFVDTHVYFYRRTPGSIINTWNKKRADVLDVTERIESFFSDNQKVLPAARSRRLSANFNIFILASIHSDEQIAQRCWPVIKRLRNSCLRNSKVRFKNKIGILISYLGKKPLILLGKILYR